ncbi:MAG: galactosyldiacylglycerol synthase [Lentisphaerae bacterium GWF2_52_8]|nr:MAG: galactosyldiacylglycerol synthase [Lentisphaerae bacterium GWF2_52_8]
MQKKDLTVAILSVSAGAGHVRAAEALRRSAEEYFPGVFAIHLDLMDMVSKPFKKLYADSYIKIVDRIPALWGFLYEKTDKLEKEDSLLKNLRMALQRLNTSKLASTLEELNPDHVICTHFLPAELISRMRRKGTSKILCWVQVTDFDVHSLWIHPEMAGYFAACPEVAWRMKDRGIPEKNIHVTGIPIMPAFRDKYSRAQCAAELGVNPKKTTILLMSGGLGVGNIQLIAERLLALPYDFQVIALAGKNQALLEDMQKLASAHPGRLFPAGFTSTIERYMAISDIAVTKPGGLTSSECLAMGLPMIVISPIPGQEERNADYLLEQGAALKAHDAAGLEFRLMELLSNPARLEKMRKCASTCARPSAADAVLNIVLNEQNGNA